MNDDYSDSPTKIKSQSDQDPNLVSDDLVDNDQEQPKLEEVQETRGEVAAREPTKEESSASTQSSGSKRVKEALDKNTIKVSEDSSMRKQISFAIGVLKNN